MQIVSRADKKPNRKKEAVKPLDNRESRTQRRRFTDSIKLFCVYADIHGSKSPERYYMVFSKLLKAITGVENRKAATVAQKQFLEVCEVAVISGINEGMYNSVGYKQIYKNIKKKLEDISKLV